MIYVYAERFKVRVYRAANKGEQLHLLVKAKNRKQLADFLRVLAGRVAVTVTGAKKGLKRIGKFWDYLTWSRLVNWGQDFFQVQQYVQFTDETDLKSSHSKNIGFLKSLSDFAEPGWRKAKVPDGRGG